MLRGVAEACRILGVDRNKVKSWAYIFREYLSSSANPKSGQPRQFSDVLGNHLKTGHTLSVQNRPMGLAEDVIVLPCRSVHLQGAIRDVAVMACFQAFLMHVMVVVAPPGSRLAE
jgi:hypothetical protein